MPDSFNLSIIINFVLGMITGVIAFLGLFIFFSWRGKHIDLNAIKRPEVDVSEEDLKQLVLLKQQKLKRLIKYDSDGAFKNTLSISYEVIEEISRYFFPKSRYPKLELSNNEMLMLNHYITDRLDQIMDIPILKHAKRLRVIQIVNMYEKKRTIEQNKLLKMAKKAKLDKVLKYGAMAMNAVNPVYWFRKLVINTSLDVMTRKVCVLIVGVVGEETVKVYSKKLFETDLELNLVEESLNELIEESESDEGDS